jgi:phosphopantothenoylcysteine synthetase/decarboxylase
MTRPKTSVLYVIVCGSPAARNVGDLVTLAQRDGWDVCVVASPDGRKFIDVPALAAQTGHPVRSQYKNPGDPDVLPPPDALIVAPATVNSTVKFAAAMPDTLPVGLLVEALGLDLPIVMVPFTNRAVASHPAFGEAMRRLRTWGVTVLFGNDIVELWPPGAGDARAEDFPWAAALTAANQRRRPSDQRTAGDWRALDVQ